MVHIVLLTAVALAIVGPAPAMATNSTAASGPVPPRCLHGICMVESGCRMPSPVCHMDVGSLSCGPYQIKLAYWQDAQLKGGSLMGDWKKCTETFPCSEQAVQGYMERHATKRRLGHDPTCEDFARIHNGGPNGYKNPNTLAYWMRGEELSVIDS